MTTDGPPKEGRRRTGLLVAAAVLAAGWLGSLAVLALRTANPVTVNRAQLLSSDAVVIAEPGGGSGWSVVLRVDSTLAGDVPEEVRAGGVEPERFAAGGRFLVPLRETDAGFVVTPAPPALKGVPLVYPATDETVRAAKEILATASAKPYE